MAERDAEEATGAEDGRRRGAPRSGSLWAHKTSCLATFAYGYFQASVVLFLPLFLIEAKDVPKEQTILITAFFAARHAHCVERSRAGSAIASGTSS